jgi:ABC-type multidrug transport system ATPase subunit
MRISIHGVCKRFGGADALNDLSLEIEPGRIIALLGVNGAGKSTLLKLMAGVLAPSAGEIRYDGELFRRDRIDLRKRFAFLPDTPAVFPEHTPIRHIGMCLRLYEAHRPGVEDLAVSLLRELDLLQVAESPLRGLSRGQMYKTQLAGLICVDPELWLLDEPFASGADPRGLSALRRYASKAAGRGATIIYSTQLLEIAESFSDEVMILSDGRLYAHESMQALRTRMGDADGALERIFADLSGS